MAAPNLAWGGFKNGQIPVDRLVDIGGGKLLEPAAAAAFQDLAAAFLERWGNALYVGAGQDTYRDLAYQKRMSGTGNHKYKPGSSIHGWARSIDLSGYGSSAKTARHVWLQENGPKFGLSWKYGAELGEPWHWDYVGPVGGGGAGGGEDDMTPDQDVMLKQIHNALFGAVDLAEGAPARPQGVVRLNWAIFDALFSDKATSRGTPAGVLGTLAVLLQRNPAAAYSLQELVAAIDAADDDEHAALLAAVKSIAAPATDLEPLKAWLLATLPQAVREELARGLISAAP